MIGEMSAATSSNNTEDLSVHQFVLCISVQILKGQLMNQTWRAQITFQILPNNSTNIRFCNTETHNARLLNTSDFKAHLAGLCQNCEINN